MIQIRPFNRLVKGQLYLCLFAIALLTIFSCSTQQTEFFISPNGNDQNSGSITQPFATLERARNAIREAKDKNDLSPMVGFKVYLREGDYSMASSFMLDDGDSGNDSIPVVYRAYQDEKVSIHGGYALPPNKFKPVSDPSILNRLPKESRNHVMQINLKDMGITEYSTIVQTGMGFPAVSPTPELFFEGEAMSVARWPNTGYENIAEIVDPGSDPRNYQSDILPGTRYYVPPEKRDDPWRGFVFNYLGDRPNRWTNAGDVWLFGYWYWDWADGIVQISKIDTLKKEISTLQASWYGVRKDQRFYVFNLLEEIDSPGEWFLDRKSGMLYFYPPSEIENADIKLSMLTDPLVVMTGSNNILFEKITFNVSRGHGVQILNGRNNLIAGCTFRRLGRKAVVIGNDNTNGNDQATNGGFNNGVRNCEIYDTGKGGILIRGGDRETLTPGNNFAENNDIHDYSRLQKTYSEAIQIYGVGNRVSHNLIHDAPHSAIHFSGNDHIIEYNEIHHVNQEVDDAGAVYSGRDWTYRGNVIRYNFFHHIEGLHGRVGVFGIYLDDAMSSVEAYGNIFYKVARAFHIGGGRDHTIHNNVIVDCRESMQYDDRAYRLDSWFAGAMDPDKGTLFLQLRKVPYQSEVWKTRYPKLAVILEQNPGYPSGSIIENNLLYRTQPFMLAEIVKEVSTIENNLLLDPEVNPGFGDIEALDFRLTKDALIYQRLEGFKEIPFDKIGLSEE